MNAIARGSVALLLLLLALTCAAAAQEDIILELEETQVAGRIEETVGPQTTVPPDVNETAWPIEAVAAPASIESTVPLFERPDENSAVLMEYYSGARLTALRPVGGGFWRVQAGEKGASVMGYMRAGDLRFGRQAQREVQPAYMELRFNREATVYSYCDTGSTPIGVCDTEHVYYAMSRTDEKWVQLFLPPVNHVREQENRATAGFVYMETGLGRGFWHEQGDWTVEPLPGELSFEAVRLQAIEAVLADLSREEPEYFMMNRVPSHFARRERLEEMECRVQLKYTQTSTGPDAGSYNVYFWEDGLEGTVVWYRIYEEENAGQWHMYFVAPENEAGFNMNMEL